jgi:lysozyme
VPRPWTDWTFWQDSESGDVPGVEGPCDTNSFNGDLDALKEYAARSLAPL